MRVSLINYGAGNTLSVSLALQRLGVEVHITESAEELLSADRVIFPGVGEASTTMKNLASKGLDTLIPKLRQPVLGICLGMQLFCQHSEENDTACLGIIPQVVRKFPPKLKVPQVGWNTISSLQGALFEGVKEESYMYFVHSYYVEVGPHEIASSQYATNYSAAIEYKNFFGVQFHPEKSGDVGIQVLKNFIQL